MRFEFQKSVPQVLWIAGIAIIWLCVVGVGSFLGWIPL